MNLLIGALTIGLILSLLATGVLISFRFFRFPDITTDGSITVGASLAAVLIVNGFSPALATLVAFVGGAAAGAVTGVLHTRFKINELLSGILVMTALYSINLHIMGRSNVPLMSSTTLVTWVDSCAQSWRGTAGPIHLWGWEVSARDVATLFGSALVVGLVGVGLYAFFRTNLGTAMRATGDNDQMIRALGVNTGTMIILGLALSNGLIALAGALLAQYQGFADVQMGIGMIVWGLASVILGEALVGARTLGLMIAGTVMGSVLFRLLVAIALRWGLNPNDLKLITAAFVFCALVLPDFLRNLKAKARTNHA